MCKNDSKYELTNLDIVLPMEINGEVVEVEMDVYAKTVIIDGLPYIGYYVVPTGESLIEHEPEEFDLDNHLIWTYKIESIVKKVDGWLTQYFKYIVYRNNKEFCSGTFKDFSTAEGNLRNMINKLHTNRKMVDFRKRSFRDDLVGKVFTVNNVSFKVLEYIEGKNEIKVASMKDNSESIITAITVNE